MATTFTSGLSGSVTAGGTVVAGLNSWSLQKTINVIPTPTFNMSADANGVYWNQYPLFGLAEASCDLEGHFDVGDNSESRLYVGQTVTLNLYFVSAVPFGYTGLVAKIKSISASTNASNNSPATFKASAQLTGTVAAAS